VSKIQFHFMWSRGMQSIRSRRPFVVHNEKYKQ